MLRLQPMQLIKSDSEHYLVRCQTFDSRDVEFTFTVESNETNIGDRRQIKHQDAFFFVAHDDEGGWALLKAVANFDKFGATEYDTSSSVLGLPSSDLHPTSLQLAGNSPESSAYEIVFASNSQSARCIFHVSGRGDKKVVSFKNQTRTASLDGVWWKLEGSEFNERSLVLALLYFDWAHNFEYTKAQLKERSEKIPWDTIFLQSEKNDERRQQLQAKTHSSNLATVVGKILASRSRKKGGLI